MKREARRSSGSGRAARRSGRVLKWTAAIGVLALLVYGVSQMSSIAYTDRDLPMINFSDLDSNEKRAALEAANEARCTCGCGMNLAQCVATDSTCPVRTSNIDRIRGMVAQADAP